jgi:hypothetical protein
MAGDLLCLACSRSYGILFDLLRKNPGLTGADLAAMKLVFEWRARRDQEWWQSLKGHNLLVRPKISA